MKKVYTILCSLILAFSGIFMVACTGGYANISLSANVSNLEIGLGESAEVIFSIDNFAKGMSDEISISVDRAYVSLGKPVKLGNGKTKIAITGLHGGSTTLRAKTFEGEKVASVELNITEPLKDFDKKNKTLYIISGSSFTPESNDYTFYPETTNERNLHYYIYQNGIRLEFTKVNAIPSDEDIVLKFEVPEGAPAITDIVASHAQEIQFLAVFNGHANQPEIVVDNSFFVLKSIDEKATKLYYTYEKGDDGLMIEASDISLVSNVFSKSEIYLSLSVPSISNNLTVSHFTGSQLIYLTPTNENHKVINGDRTIFNFKVSTNSINAGASSIGFNVHYEGFDDYAITKNYDASVLVAPRTITANDYIQSSMPAVTIYNQNKGSYGQKEIDLAIFPQDATYDYLKITGMGEGFILTYRDRIVNENTKIDDLSYPLIVKGREGTSETESSFTIEVVSGLLEEGEIISFKVNLEIVQGANTVSFTDPLYLYSETNPSSGVFVELKNGSSLIFDGIRISPEDSYIGKLILQPIDDASDYISVSQLLNEDGTYSLKLKLQPKKEGLATYRVILENGAFIQVTFKIITPFKAAAITCMDSEYVEQTNSETIDTDNGSYSSVSSIVIRNSSASLGNVVVSVIEPFGGLIKNVTYNVTTGGDFITIGSVSEGGLHKYQISALRSGAAQIVFTAGGQAVENFKIVNSRYDVNLQVILFKQLEEFKFTKGDGIGAHSIDIYTGDVGADTHLQKVSLTPVFEPSDAFGYYDPVHNISITENISQDAIYFTYSKAAMSVTGINTPSSEEVDRLVYGYKYALGSMAVFDTKTFTFELREGYTGNIDITLYANVRQYKQTYTFEIKFISKKYVSVGGIGLYNYIESINLDATRPEEILNAYVTASDPSLGIPTNTEIVMQFIPDEGTPSNLIIIEPVDNPDATTSIFKITYDSALLAASSKASGVIKAASKSWLNPDGSFINPSNQGLTIPIFVGDGSIDKPLYISSAEELLNIGGSKESLGLHYRIDNVIDFSNKKSFTPIGAFKTSQEPDPTTGLFSYDVKQFTGSIIGTKQASIVGLNINSFAATSSKNYSGLFAILGAEAKISGINFSGSINIDDTVNISGDAAELTIGLLAAENFGEIINCSFTLDKSNINIGGKINFGTVTGINNGNLYNFVSKNTYNTNLAYMRDIANLNAQFGGFAGGVTGINNGNIVRAMKGDIKLYNFASYTAFTQINAGDKITLGGIAGYNASNIGSEVNLASYDGKKYYYPSDFKDPASVTFAAVVGGEINGTDNVGGAVGELALGNLENITSRVFVRGKNAVGTLVGKQSDNKANIKNSVCEAVDDGLRNDRNLSLIIRNGVQTVEEEEHLINQTSAVTDEEKLINDKIRDILIGTGGNIVPSTVNLKLYTYITRNMVPNVTSNDSYYGDMIEIDEQNDAIIYHRVKFEERLHNIGVSEIKNEMKNVKNSENPDDTPVFSSYQVLYMFYYASADPDTQNQLNSLNILTNDNPNYPFVLSGDVFVSSDNIGIMTIDERGTITLRGTGLCKITVRSALNANAERILYVYVVPFANTGNVKTTVYAASTKENYLIGDDSVISVYKESPVTIYLGLESGDNGYIVSPGNTLVKLVENTLGGLKIDYKDENGIDLEGTEEEVNAKKFTNYSKTGTNYTFFKNSDIAGVNRVIINATFDVTIGTERFSSKINEPINVVIEYKKGTTEIVFDNEYFEIMPRDIISFDINTTTDASADYLRMTYAKIGTSDLITNPYYTYIGAPDELTSEDSNSLFSVNYTSQKVPGIGNKYKLDISIKKANPAPEDYGEYLLSFSAENGYTKQIKIKLLRQGIDNIIIDNYESSASSSLNDFVSDITVPGKIALLNMKVFPTTADFDRIEVLNHPDNSLTGRSKAIMELVDESNKRINGFTILPNGISFEKPLFSDEAGNVKKNIRIQYVIPTEGVDNNVPIKFIVRTYKGNSQIYEDVVKTVNTKLDASVKISIRDREPNVADGHYMLARGLRYPLDLDVYGFEFNEIQVESSNTSAATIVKENGQIYLQMTKDTISYPADDVGLKFKLTSYGLKADGTRSGEYSIDICLLEYVLLVNNNNAQNMNLISGMYDGKVKVAVGNKLELGITLTNGLSVEYDDSILAVRDSVAAFCEMLKNGGSFEVQTNLTSDDINGVPVTNADGSLRVDEYGKYILNEKFTKITKSTKLQTMYFSTDGLSIIPTRIIDYNNPTYKFRFTVNYAIRNGVYIITDYGNKLETSFVLDVYQRSSSKSPIPITNYSQLMAMQNDSYYILLSDISLPNDFKPITATVKGFDGNGHTIKLSGSYIYDDIDNFGLFETVSLGAIIRNVNIEITTNTSIYMASGNPFKVGFITPTNNGVITNCYVYYNSYSVLSVINYLSGQASGTSYVAGIAATNNSSGKITNCRVSLNIYSSSNLSGLVGINNGKISSSYFKDGSLLNVSQSIEDKTAGLVIENSKGAQIITSYVAGRFANPLSIYADDMSSAITSSQICSAFVDTNEGEIENCYANIPVIGSTFSSGFVFNNGGTIFNSYSTSKMENSLKSNYPFVKENQTQTSEGSFENCYYLVDGSFNYSIASNAGLAGLTLLKSGDFLPTDANIEKYFSAYAISKSEKSKGIWFIPEQGQEAEFIYNGEFMHFAYGRLELVAPNIISTSKQVLNENATYIDPATGETIYAYMIADGQPAFGSKYNPYILTSFEEFENEIYDSSNANVNTQYFRLVNDLNYNDTSSKLFQTVFCGDMEGNGMKIEGFILDNNSYFLNAGLFAQIGSANISSGSVKNLSLAPSVVSFPNTSCVGSLAGTLDGGFVFNIDVDGFSYAGTDGMVVQGFNIVGGLVGRAINNYKIHDINSTISAKANYTPSINGGNITDAQLTYNSNNNNYSTVSYAGTVAGVMDGLGEARYLNASGKIAAIAEKAGIIAGRIGNNSAVYGVSVTVPPEAQFVRALYYGGIVVGELVGSLTDVRVFGNGNQYDYFKSVPCIPKAVGGIAGVLKGGTLNLAVMEQSIKNNLISTIGGLVGVAYKGNINQSIVKADIESGVIIGGAIGSVAYEQTLFGSVNISQVGIKPGTLSVYSDFEPEFYVGGIIGTSANNTNVTILNSYCNAMLKVYGISYNGQLKAYVSGLVGHTIIGESSSTTRLVVTNCYANGVIDVSLIDKFGSYGSEMDTIVKAPNNQISNGLTENPYGSGNNSGSNNTENNITVTSSYTVGDWGAQFNTVLVRLKATDLRIQEKLHLVTNTTFGNVIRNNTPSGGENGDPFTSGKYIYSADPKAPYNLYDNWKIHNVDSSEPYVDQIWRKTAKSVPYLVFEDNL